MTQKVLIKVMILSDLSLFFEIQITEFYETPLDVRRVNETPMRLKEQAKAFSGCLSYTCFTNIVSLKASVSILSLLNFNIVSIQ